MIVIELRCIGGLRPGKARGRVGRAFCLSGVRRGQAVSYCRRRSSASAAAACSAAFLLRPCALPITSPSTLAATSKTPVVRRARLAGDLVGYACALARKPLLKRGLEVEQASPRRARSRSANAATVASRRRPRSRGAGSRRRSPPRRPTRGRARRRAARRRRSRPRASRGAASRSISGRPSSLGDLGAGPAADRLAVHLGQPADVGARDSVRNRCSATARPSTLSPRKASRP